MYLYTLYLDDNSVRELAATTRCNSLIITDTRAIPIDHRPVRLSRLPVLLHDDFHQVLRHLSAVRARLSVFSRVQFDAVQELVVHEEVQGLSQIRQGLIDRDLEQLKSRIGQCCTNRYDR
jgi:hypothetical protein